MSAADGGMDRIRTPEDAEREAAIARMRAEFRIRRLVSRNLSIAIAREALKDSMPRAVRSRFIKEGDGE